MYEEKPSLSELYSDILGDELQHVGIPHEGSTPHSGRYEYGSGENAYQHSIDFISRVNELRKQGIKETDICKMLGYVDDKTGHTQSTRLRADYSLARSTKRAADVRTAESMRAHGHSLTDIANKMGYPNESSIRALLNEKAKNRMNAAEKTADHLKKLVDEKGMIDVGVGVERELGVSKEKLKQALIMLEQQGYPTYGGGVPQVTNHGKQTNLQVLCPPGTEHKEIYNFDKINSVQGYESHDGGETFEPKFVYPKSLDSKRIAINYAEDGGLQKDGLIEIRPGVPDLSLGESHYSQVRILVDGTHYLKGMAAYADDLPDGVDVRFNTNKKRGTPMMADDKNDPQVLKPIKKDPDNPFGSSIKPGIDAPSDSDNDGFKGGQSYYIDKNGKKQLSLINKARDEGDWMQWKDSLPSQFLGKQSQSLINRQLGLAEANKREEFDKIMALTNPTVKKKLLMEFANDCDSAAVHLQAAALPRQKFHVILPMTSISENEIYAPRYKDGELVACVRFPHGSTSEIPILRVNNKLEEGRKLMGAAPLDAVGIGSKVAERLSGADFDGDTVMVVPCNQPGKIHISNKPQLEGLVGYDPKVEYGGKKRGTFKEMGKEQTQIEMGKISNLITDMTLRGAPDEEIARALRHSMTVIDANKHHLDYRQSEMDNGIKALKRKWQGNYDDEGRYHEGAGTILSRAKSPEVVLKRKGMAHINTPFKSNGEPNPYYDPSRPEGALIYKSVEEHYTDKKGKDQVRTQNSTKMAEVDDAYKLTSGGSRDNPGNLKEQAYAEYANHMKALGNEARKAYLTAGKIKYDKTAKETYRDEVRDLETQLAIAEKNAPRERQAQVMANSIVKAKKLDNPDMDKSELKKIEQRALSQTRAIVGAKRQTVDISPKQWEAIQAGAISETKLMAILNHTDTDKIRQYATPRNNRAVSQAQINKAKFMVDMAKNSKIKTYTLVDIAEACGMSVSTLTKIMKE